MITGPKVTVILQRRTRSSDGHGGSADTWNDVEEFKAVLSPTRFGKEGLKYNKELLEGDHLLYCKTLTNTITNFDRITYNGRIFAIKAIQTPMMSNKVLKLGLLEIK